MNTLADQIPDGFFRLFARKNMSVLIEYLKAIYNAIISGNYGVKGITIADCRNIVANISVDGNKEDYSDETVELDNDPDFTNYHLRFLCKTGWLFKRFDADIYDYMITVPEYSKVFIQVFIRLEESLTQSVKSMRSVYASVDAYKNQKGKKDIGLLEDALQDAKSLNVGLYSVVELRRVQISNMLKLDNGIEILRALIKNTERNPEDGTEFDHGRFISYHGQIMEDIEAMVAIIQNEQKEIELLRARPNTVEVIESLDQKEKGLKNIRDLIQDIEKECDQARAQFYTVHKCVNEMSSEALKKYEFAMLKNVQRGAPRLITLMAKLKEEKDAGGNTLLRTVQEMLARPWKPDIYLDHKLYEPNEDRKNVEFYMIPENIQQLPVESYIKSKFSDDELMDFRARFTIDGKMTIGPGDLTTDEDLDKYIFMSISLLQDEYQAKSISLGAIVHVKDGYAYTAFEMEE